MWDETMILKLAENLGYLDFIQSLPERIKKIDFARYMILYQYGGVVLDVDFEAFKPIDKLLQNHSVVLIEESENQSINCAWIASIPNHSLWIRVIDEIISRQLNKKFGGVIYITGPKMLTDVSKEWEKEQEQHQEQRQEQQQQEAGRKSVLLSEDGDKKKKKNMRLHILRHATGENRLFYPYNADHMVGVNGASNREKKSSSCSVENTCAKMYPNSMAMHHFAATWYDEYARQIGL